MIIVALYQTLWALLRLFWAAIDIWNEWGNYLTFLREFRRLLPPSNYHPSMLEDGFSWTSQNKRS